jgi:hypothetical protein
VRSFYNFYYSTDIIRMVKLMRVKWGGSVACMGEKQNAYRVLVGKLEGKRPQGRLRHTGKDDIKMVLKAVGWDNVDWIHLAQDRDL